MTSPSVVPLTCANWISCRKEGTRACSNCRLVAYCGMACQRVDWSEHKKQCKSSMAKSTWRPLWDYEGRQPHWATEIPSRRWHNVFGGSKYLWGNTPAIDVVNLERNEGPDFKDDLHLLFAASGDIRHVVESLSAMPATFRQRIEIVINDKDFDVVARNVILLLIALDAAQKTEDTYDVGQLTLPKAVEALIHIWYSAFIPSWVTSHLQARIKAFFTEVCTQLLTEIPVERHTKTWHFHHLSIRLTLLRKHWLLLANYLDLPTDIDAGKAKRMRTNVTLAPERKDYRDRWYFKEASPFTRVAKQRFREDGLLLPFGHPRVEFDNPNPTFFQNFEWPMDDKADPSNGWAIAAVDGVPWPASRDLYGKLYKHQVTLTNFITTLRNTKVSFEVLNADIRDLPRCLDVGAYSRIEVSNVCDRGYIGIRNAISLLSPLLQGPQQNSHATLITLFINATKEAMKFSGADSEMPDIAYLSKFIPAPSLSSMLSLTSAAMTRFWDARDLAINVEEYFTRYTTMLDFSSIACDFGIKIKAENTIIEKWPTRPKFCDCDANHVGDNAEEFWKCLGSDFTTLEWYVEWTKSR